MSEQRYEANRETVGALLSTTSPKIAVPEWQRSYSWDTAQIETFWADLIAFDRRYPDENIANQEYFLGSIVLVTGGDQHVLLDGQQRLATATILLSVLRDGRRDYKSDAASRLDSKYISDFDDGTERTTYVLTLNEYDRDFFRSEIQATPPNSQQVSATLKSHTRIKKARQYFERELARLAASDQSPKETFDRNLRIGRVLTDHLSMVVVTSSDEDNASSVFETLNDRGIGLSTPDLLRNLLIRKSADPPSRQGVVAAWQSILALEDEVPVDQLLRHYWVSLRGDVKARALYREMKDVIEDESMDPLRLSQEIAEAALIYRDLVSCQVDNHDLKDSLEAIRSLGATVLYPVLLSAFSVHRQNESLIAPLAGALVTLFVRYNVIGGRESTILEATVFKSASSLRADHDLNRAIGRLRELAPDGRDFEQRFERAVITRAATARYLLRQIEQHLRATEEMMVQGPHRVHLEHIYPQNPQEGQRLTAHAGVLNMLGNLTLLSRRLNIAIKNSSFEEKKSAAYSTSEVLMTRKLLEIAGPWDAEAIRTRQKMLASVAFEVWHFPGETKEAERNEVEVPSAELANEVELPEVPDC
jgi:hypothetical protein